jgi:hypothetical protein
MQADTKRAASALLLVTAFAWIGCGKPEPPPPARTAPAPQPTAPPPVVAFRVLGVELGGAIGPDKRVTDPRSTFGVNDTIYVSIATEGASSGATLAARWTYGDEHQLVNEMSETIAPSGPAATEFHISKPSPWPVGKYRVEVSLNGDPAGTREFEVR